MAVALVQLESALQVLKGSDLDFAQSLARQWVNRGYLAPNQMVYADKLVARAQSASSPVEPAAMAKIFGLFAAAEKAGLRYPKVRLGNEIVLSPAGYQSKYPGSIQVKAPGGFDAPWYGRVNADGTISKGRDWEFVDAAFKAWVADPAAAATAYGKATGCCAFCSKELTDARSVAMGYGPVCADNYGLPWGEKVAADVEIEATAA